MNDPNRGATVEAGFEARMRALAAWREQVAGALDDMLAWIAEQSLADTDSYAQLAELAQQAHDDKLRIAFVAEFSRGKTELINAMFFAGFGERMLPSGVGTTTQCPTEIAYDPRQRPSLKLLPIETREGNAPLSAFADRPELWTTVSLDLSSPAGLVNAFAQVTETHPVRVSQAIQYGLYHPNEGGAAILPDGTISVPRWRHAVINFPHPLLAQGLVILDTPGLNAIGTEPELTLSLIPDAHAVIFVLGIDTGLTKSDLEIWDQCVLAERAAVNADEHVALVALNKIDGLWGEGNDDQSRAADVQRQVRACAQRLSLLERRVFPVSAKKALIARTLGDAMLLEKSRLPALERALGDELIPAHQRSLAAKLREALEQTVNETDALIHARLADVREHRAQLTDLRGKNDQLASQLTGEVSHSNHMVDALRKQLDALRAAVAPQATELIKQFELAVLRERVGRTRAGLLATRFSHRMGDPIATLFTELRRELAQASQTITRVHELVAGQTERMRKEFGWKVSAPLRFPSERFARELERLEQQNRRQFQSLLSLLVNRQSTLVGKSFEALADRLETNQQTFNRDLTLWLKRLISPLGAQLGEREQRLARRLDSMKKLVIAGGDLEKRLTELWSLDNQTAELRNELGYLTTNARRALDQAHKDN